jgi:hypothetical protein
MGPPAALGSSDPDGNKTVWTLSWVPAVKRLQDLDVPDLSSGKSRKLPRFSRCAAAPWREDIVDFDSLPDNLASSLDNYAQMLIHHSR